MSGDGEKDRWGDKLRDAEKAREELYFAEQEKKLLAKLKQKDATGTCSSCGAAFEGAETCPSCGHARSASRAPEKP